MTRVLVGLAAVVLVVGIGGRQVLGALGGLGPATVLAALGLGVVTTAAGAIRWWVLARWLGLALTPGAALARCYEAQFLNLVLPGGVLGDARRGLGHGREHGGGPGTVRALGAVVLERAIGQAVLVTAALVAVVTASGRPPSTIGATVVLGLVALGLVALGLLGAVVALARSRAARWAALRRVAADGVRAVLDPRAGPVAVGCSLVVVVGLVGVFVLAARTVGVVAAPGVLVGQALLALLAMAVPLGLAGWGPREAATAAGFAAAGLDVRAGVATAAVYGVLALIAALPGGALLLVGRLRATVGRMRHDDPGVPVVRHVVSLSDTVAGTEEDRPWAGGPATTATPARSAQKTDAARPRPPLTIPAPRSASPTTASPWPTSAPSSPG